MKLRFLNVLYFQILDLSGILFMLVIGFLLCAHMVSDREKQRGWKWRSERATEVEREKSHARSLPHFFFSLSLCSVCGISRCSSETPASREGRQRFLTVSLL